MAESLFRTLREYNHTMLPMHMPGHKRNLALSGEDGYLAALCADCDITEIAGFDNLAEPEDVLLSIRKRAAVLWHSEDSYLSVNGSTGAILASIFTTVSRKETVIMARNCHKSVYNGLQLADARPVYLLPERDAATGAGGAITPEMVEAALREQKAAKLVVITSPTYEGVVSDVEGICHAAHAYGVPVLVDSAHGAHFGFGEFPKSAVDCGADLVVQSIHKTLPSLTQTAILHRNGSLVSAERLQNALNIFQTSSPSYLLMASVEGCIGLLEERGELLFERWCQALSEFYRAAEMLRLIKVIGTDQSKTDAAVFARDKSKIIISTRGTDLTGPELMERLRTEHRIELEMAADRYGLAMTGMGDTEESLARLLQALFAIDAQCGKGPVEELLYPGLPKVCRSVTEAMCDRTEECELKDAVGKIAAEYVWAYPPGVPLLVPGEEISKEIVRFLLRKEADGVQLHRTYGGGGDTVRCILSEGKELSLR